MRRSLNKLFEEYTQDMVYSYQSFFDREVYNELARMSRTLIFSLDDYFKYDFRKKPLEQIISDEILLGEYEDDSEIIKHIDEYIDQHRKYLASLSFEKIKDNHIYWGFLA